MELKHSISFEFIWGIETRDELSFLIYFGRASNPVYIWWIQMCNLLINIEESGKVFERPLPPD